MVPKSISQDPCASVPGLKSTNQPNKQHQKVAENNIKKWWRTTSKSGGKQHQKVVEKKETNQYYCEALSADWSSSRRAMA
jgi:hypothetical protein